MPVLGIFGHADITELFITHLVSKYDFLLCKVLSGQDRKLENGNEGVIFFENFNSAEAFWLKRPSNEFYIVQIIDPNDGEVMTMFEKRTLFLLVSLRRKNDLIDPKLFDLAGFSIIFDVEDGVETREKLGILAENMSLNKQVWYRPDWDTYFMEMARLASRRSNCSKRRIGCILVSNFSVIATGYNGTARSLPNCFDGGCPRCNAGYGSGNDLASCLCLHAEENALLEAGRHRAIGSILYCTTAPCLQCSKKIVQCGVKRVVYAQEYSVQHDCRRVLGAALVEIDKYHYRDKVYFLSEQKTKVHISCASIDDVPISSIEEITKSFETIPSINSQE